jgi:hypothetical protein
VLLYIDKNLKIVKYKSFKTKWRLSLESAELMFSGLAPEGRENLKQIALISSGNQRHSAHQFRLY